MDWLPVPLTPLLVQVQPLGTKTKRQFGARWEAQVGQEYRQRGGTIGKVSLCSKTNLLSTTLV